MADTNHEGRQRVYLTVHENFVREDIHYQDWKTGEERSFNLVTLPMGTVVDGEDLGGWQFSALFVDETDARDLRNALSFVDKASEQGLFPDNEYARKFRDQLREYTALLDKAVTDPLGMSSTELNRMYDLRREFLTTCVRFVRGDEQNPAPAQGSVGRDCAMAVFQVLTHNYAEHQIMGGQEPSAARRIENEQALISARNGVPTDLQIARILALRQIAESVRGSRAKLDQRHVDPRELNEMTRKLLNDPVFRQVMQQHQNDQVLRAAAIAVVTVIIVIAKGIQILPAFQHALQQLQIRPGRAVGNIAGKDQRIIAFRKFQSLFQTLLLGDAAGFFQKSSRLFLRFFFCLFAVLFAASA